MSQLDLKPVKRAKKKAAKGKASAAPKAASQRCPACGYCPHCGQSAVPSPAVPAADPPPVEVTV